MREGQLLTARQWHGGHLCLVDILGGVNDVEVISLAVFWEHLLEESIGA